MVDLSLWNSTIKFSRDQAAALIAGIEPGAGLMEHRALPIQDRLSDAYQLAKAFHLNDLAPAEEQENDSLRFDGKLSSNEMNLLADSARTGSAYRFHLWLIDDDRSSVDSQMFSRDELTRWLKYSGLSSLYEFDLGHKVNTDGSGKALSPRERDTLLNIIGGMLELMLDQRPKRADTSNQAKIIKALVDSYGDKPGISARTIQEKFAAANRALKQT